MKITKEDFLSIAASSLMEKDNDFMPENFEHPFKYDAQQIRNMVF